MLGAIRTGGSQLPAARVRPVGELTWFADRAAAAGV
jgi:6-phosphogluconolactonase